MKITIEQTIYEGKQKASVEVDHDDCGLEEMYEIFTGLLEAQGYFAKEYFKELRGE